MNSSSNRLGVLRDELASRNEEACPPFLDGALVFLDRVRVVLLNINDTDPLFPGSWVSSFWRRKIKRILSWSLIRTFKDNNFFFLCVGLSYESELGCGKYRDNGQMRGRWGRVLGCILHLRQWAIVSLMDREYGESEQLGTGCSNGSEPKTSAYTGCLKIHGQTKHRTKLSKLRRKTSPWRFFAKNIDRIILWIRKRRLYIETLMTMALREILDERMLGLSKTGPLYIVNHSVGKRGRKPRSRKCEGVRGCGAARLWLAGFATARRTREREREAMEYMYRQL